MNDADYLNAKLGYNLTANVSVGTGAGSSGSLVPATGPASTILTPANWLLGAFIGLILLKLLGDSPKTDIKGEDIFVGGYNVFVILFIVFTGVPLAKIIANRWLTFVPGLPDLINAV